MAEHSQQALSRKTMKNAGWLDKPGFPALEDFQVPTSVIDMFGGAEAAYHSPHFTALVHAFHAALIVAKAGDPVFVLSSDIVHALRDTEVPNVSSEELKLPFEGINIDFPVGTLQDPAHRVSRLMVFQATEDKFRVVYHWGEYTSYLGFWLKEGTKVYDCIDDAMRHQWDDLNDPEAIRRFQKENMYEDYWKTDMFRLAVNAVLYVTSPDADVVQDKTQQHLYHTKLQGMGAGIKRNVLLNKLSQAKRTKRFIVGAKFRLSEEYQAKLTSSGKSWVLEHRVRVMGHFKMQPHGPGKTERKRIWVAPYWKGPTFAEMVQKGYVVR